jgi:cobalt-zinc-cadmium efflux system outer membrane protein
MFPNLFSTGVNEFFPRVISCGLFYVSVILIFIFPAVAFAQEQPTSASAQTSVKSASAEFVAPDGLSIERLIELGTSRRADLLAARQRLAIAEGRLRQADTRPNPTLDGEYGTAKILGGGDENDFSLGVTQVFETGGKRSRRRTVAELELAQIRFEVAAVERQLIVGIRTAYTNALASARRLDVLEKLIFANEEVVRVTEARLKEGDVAPLDVNLVKVENDRLKVQAIEARSDAETQLLQIRTLVGADLTEILRLAPQAERPPRFDLGLNELTAIALKERPDLQAARLGEELGTARINLAKSNAVPNVAGSIRYTRSRRITDFPATFGGSVVNRDNELTFGVSVEIPVFNRNQGEIAAASGEKQQAARTREFLESNIRRDVAVAYRKYRAAAESLVIYSTQILPRSEDNLRAVRAAYGLGEFSVFEVVNEQRRLTENVTNYNQILRDYYNNLTELETALGTTLPAAGFASDDTSVLPDLKDNPNQIDRAKLLKSIEEVKMPKRSITMIAGKKEEK